MKRDTFKRIAAAVLCFIMLFSLTACQSTDAKNVDALIAGLGDISVDSQSAVEMAEAAYNALSESDKEQVKNAQALQDARAALEEAFRQADIENVQKLIAGLGQITLDSEAAVKAAQEAFAALPEADKALVSNAQALTEAKEALEKAVRKAAIDNVDMLIAALGEITVDSQAAVEAAEKAFAALPEGDRALVEAAQVLTEARETLNKALLEAKRQAIVGSWIAEADGTEAMAQELAKEMQMDADEIREAVGKFSFKSTLDLRDDGTYKLVMDADSFRESVSGVLQAIKPMMRQMIVKMIAKEYLGKEDASLEDVEAELGVSIDELFQSLLGMSLDDVIDLSLSALDSDEMYSSMADAEQEGRYLIDLENNIFYFSESLDEEPNTENGENFTMQDGVIEIVDSFGKGFFDQFYPVKLTKEA